MAEGTTSDKIDYKCINCDYSNGHLPKTSR